MAKLLTDPENPQLQILCRLQNAVLKQRNLNAAASDVYNGTALGHNAIEIFSAIGHGFDIQKALLGVCQHINPDSGFLLPLRKDDGGIRHLPDRRGAVRLILLHTVGIHDLPVFLQNIPHLLDAVKRELAGRIGLASQINLAHHMIDLPDSPGTGNLEYFHSKLIASYINRCKCAYCHKRTPFCKSRRPSDSSRLFFHYVSRLLDQQVPSR